MNYDEIITILADAYKSRETQMDKLTEMVSRSEARVDRIAEMVRNLMQTTKTMSEAHSACMRELALEKARCQELNAQLVSQNSELIKANTDMIKALEFERKCRNQENKRIDKILETLEEAVMRVQPANYSIGTINKEKI